MEKILNLAETIKQRKEQDITTQLLQVTMLQSLQDITQEINVIVGAWSSLKIEEGSKKNAATLQKVAALIGNDYMYNLRELLLLHAGNLEAIAKMMNSVIKEPDLKQKQELYEIRQEIATDYQKNNTTIYTRNLNEAIDIIQNK